MLLRICYDRRVGYGIESVTMIPVNTKILFYDGNVMKNETAHGEDNMSASHYKTIRGTGCTLDGSWNAVLGQGVTPEIGKIHNVPCNLMSLTNSSQGHKPANCEVFYDDQDSRKYKNGMWLNTTAWLITTQEIPPFEELVWDYTVR